MNTKKLTWDNLKEAAEVLKNGGLLAFPTETVYGLGCIYDDESAFKKLVEVKKRPPLSPFTLMCSSFAQAIPLVKISAKPLNLIKNMLPGELTLLLPAKEGVPHWVNLGLPTIGIRVPAYEKLRALIDLVGKPLLVPSANKSGEQPCKNMDEVLKVFDGEIDAAIAGDCPNSLPSTIVDLTDGLKLVRQGPISLEEVTLEYNKDVMNIVVGADHGGFALKEAIKAHLLEAGFSINDVGTHSEDSCDYPIFAKLAAKEVASGKADFGVICCTSAEGISIAANKIKGIRCGIGYDDDATAKCREHNNCNMIAFGQKYMATEDVLRRVDIFLSTSFSPLEKHHRRVIEIENLETK